MRALRTIQCRLAGFLVLTFVLGLLSIPTPKHEIFPFFSWFLFSEVPNTQDIYYLVAHKADGTRLETHRKSDQNPGLFRRNEAIKAGRVIRKAAISHEKGDTKSFGNAVALLEDRYLRRSIVRYEIWKRHEDPLTYWFEPQTEGILVVKITRSEEDL